MALIYERCAVHECRNKRLFVPTSVRQHRIRDEEESETESTEENIVSVKPYVALDLKTLIDVPLTHIALFIVRSAEKHKSIAKNSQPKLQSAIVEMNPIALKNGKMIQQEGNLYQSNSMLSACNLSST